jgi:hypothetical protein
MQEYVHGMIHPNVCVHVRVCRSDLSQIATYTHTHKFSASYASKALCTNIGLAPQVGSSILTFGGTLATDQLDNHIYLLGDTPSIWEDLTPRVQFNIPTRRGRTSVAVGNVIHVFGGTNPEGAADSGIKA